MTDAIPTWADHAHRAYNDSVRAVARRLRDVADEIERKGVVPPEPSDRPVFDGCGPFTYAAHNVAHSLAWGVANAHLASVITAAGTADGARAAARLDAAGGS